MQPSTVVTHTQRMRGLYKLTRLQKFPLGAVLIFWPYGFGLLMASFSHNSPAYAVAKNWVLFLVAATLMHSAFCVWNDICDRDLDGKVERTRNRPLVTGVVSIRDALVLFALVLVSTLSVTALVNETAFRIMVSSLPVNFVYPLTKRWTWWPQFWLGIACSWGCLVSWLSVSGVHLLPLERGALFSLCISVVCWMIFNDTIYATQDQKDDEIAGIKSTARLFGSHLRLFNALFAALFVVFLTLSGVFNGNGPTFFGIGCGGAAIHVAWQIFTWRAEHDGNNLLIFKRSDNVGMILCSALFLDYMLN